MSGGAANRVLRDQGRIRLLADARRDLVAACYFCVGRARPEDVARLQGAVASIVDSATAGTAPPPRLAALAEAARTFLDSAQDPAARRDLDQRLSAYWRDATIPAPAPARRWWLDKNGGDAA